MRVLGDKNSEIANDGSKKKGVAFLAPALAFFAAILAGLPARSACAAESDVGAVCAATLEQAGASAQGAPGADSAGSADSAHRQKLQYCQAAQSAEEGANADRALYKVWGAVGVVCTYSCTASLAGGPVNEHVCTGSAMAGSATEGAVTKDFAGALSSIASAGGGFAVNQAQQAHAGAKPGAPGASAQNPKTAADQPAGKKQDFGACMQAATAIGTAYKKRSSMKSNESSARGNLQSAAAVAAPSTPGGTALKPDSQAASSGAGQGGSMPDGNGSTVAENGSPGAQGSDHPCGARGSGASVIQCAIANDRGLPSFVTSPRFANEFQKKTGQDLNGFLTREDPASLSQPLAEAMGGAVPLGQGAKLAAALDQFEKSIDSETGSQGGYYVGGGSQGADGSDGSGGDLGAQMSSMGSMMQGIMEQMNPGGGKTAGTEPTGIFAVDFAYRSSSAQGARGPASVSEDKRLNLFDRVTYRYYFVGKRVVQQQQAPLGANTPSAGGIHK